MERNPDPGKLVGGAIAVCACVISSWMVISIVLLQTQVAALQARMDALDARIELNDSRLSASGRLADLPDGETDRGRPEANSSSSGPNNP